MQSPELQKRIHRLLGDLEKITAQEQFALAHQDIETLSNLNDSKNLLLKAFLQSLNDAKVNWDEQEDLLTRLRALENKWIEIDKHMVTLMTDTQNELNACRQALKTISSVSDTYASEKTLRHNISHIESKA